MLHDDRGKFAKGNDSAKAEKKAARNARNKPLSQRTSELRKALLHAVSPTEIAVLIRMVMNKANEEGDVASAKLVLEYLVGRPLEQDLLERIEELEAILEREEEPWK